MALPHLSHASSSALPVASAPIVPSLAHRPVGYPSTSSYHHPPGASAGPVHSQAMSAPNAQPVPPAPAPAQALRTTFPSRLRAGTTALMQPLPNAPDLNDGVPVSGSMYVDEDDDVVLGITPVGAVPKLLSREVALGSGRGTPSAAEAEGSLRRYVGMPVPGSRLAVKEPNRYLHQYFTEYDMEQAASQSECLIPVRIELETDSHRIRDVFVWNMREKLITPQQFAKSLLLDLDLPLEPYTSQIENAINQAIEDAHQAGIGHADFGEREDDIRVIVEYTVQILRSTVKDRLEWDLCSGLTPESFARQLCADLGLSGEAITIISHAIREQLLIHRRAALELIRAEELETRGARPLEDVWRDLEQAREFGPLMEPLADDELEKIEMDAMRNSRRNRRAARAEGGRRRR
ncbi:Chromatin structure remodeling complex protein sfh1 [Tilletia horrida]|uniref:Chromatin structure remodeling complex protein sfh1 n=1 Tax=Tilletia horrida TaxID=155126 RepID=A0AAN6GW64_9BASI|nr:Chromatin structure remodeling complex protein sfh1 [Tilletia horrida]KAK0556147.1 Chromatin structure remodeling complex protein sfh1 [Tilletia horrida]KAK0569073.1 Chromatin structure remodeling complex protein sfh1 [Tilletia horrida]